MPKFLGVDPGGKGSLCLLDPYGDILFAATPDPFKSNRKLIETLQDLLAHGGIDAVAIEDVHSLYGMSAKSNFNFGRAVQAVTSVIQAVPLKYILVQPKQWQAAIGIPPGKYKGDAKGLKQAIAAKALELYPGVPLYGPRGGLLDGRSDALMLAHYLHIGGSK